MMADIEFSISEQNSGKYIRDIIRNDLKISSGLLTKLKKNGGIQLNGNNVTVAEKVKYGDLLTVYFPSEKSNSIQPVNIPIDIIYEDKYLLAVNKPKDMPTHPSAGNHVNTLANACMYYYRNTDFVFRSVTRLDRDTTGIVLIAKDARTGALMSEAVQKGGLHKTYYALTSAVPSPLCGKIEAPIGRADNSILKREVRPDGQYAVTEYKTIAHNNKIALEEIKLLTGRTHQIRVHFSHIGCPLLYDYMYGTEISGETLFLHCAKLEFIHPITAENMLIYVKPDFPFFKEKLPNL